MEQRKLAVIMFTDIVGYTALMGDRVLRNDPVDHFNEIACLSFNEGRGPVSEFRIVATIQTNEQGRH